MNRITKKEQIKLWVDIEKEYYNALRECFDKKANIGKLNEEFEFIKKALIAYLKNQNAKTFDINNNNIFVFMIALH